MVALAAAAVEEDPLAAVLVAHRLEARGDLGDRGVPVDLLVGAVGTPAQRAWSAGSDCSGSGRAAAPSRRCSPSSAGWRLVAADAVEAPAVELHLDAAVALAQDASAGLPVLRRHSSPAALGRSRATPRTGSPGRRRPRSPRRSRGTAPTHAAPHPRGCPRSARTTSVASATSFSRRRSDSAPSGVVTSIRKLGVSRLAPGGVDVLARQLVHLRPTSRRGRTGCRALPRRAAALW